MAMLSAQQAGPLGVGDRGMQSTAPAPDQGADSDPCPCCHGSGTVPAGTSIDDCIMQMQQEDIKTEGQEGNQGDRPAGGSPTPSASDLQSSSPAMSPERQKVRDYAQNRPSTFA